MYQSSLLISVAIKTILKLVLSDCFNHSWEFTFSVIANLILYTQNHIKSLASGNLSIILYAASHIKWFWFAFVCCAECMGFIALNRTVRAFYYGKHQQKEPRHLLISFLTKLMLAFLNFLCYQKKSQPICFFVWLFKIFRFYVVKCFSIFSSFSRVYFTLSVQCLMKEIKT